MVAAVRCRTRLQRGMAQRSIRELPGARTAHADNRKRGGAVGRGGCNNGVGSGHASASTEGSGLWVATVKDESSFRKTARRTRRAGVGDRSSTLIAADGPTHRLLRLVMAH